MRLSNVLDDYGDVKVPGSDRLVIGGCNEPPILVNEGNRVDGPEMLVVFLRDFAGVHVVLPRMVRAIQSRACAPWPYLNYLLV